MATVDGGLLRETTSPPRVQDAILNQKGHNFKIFWKHLTKLNLKRF